MILSRSVGGLVFALIAGASSAAAPKGGGKPGDDPSRLEESLKAAAGYEYGKDGRPLDQVEAIVFAASRDPQRRGAVEEKILSALASATTRDGKEFLCRQLRNIGTAKSVPALEAMLADPQLSHLGRFALGSIEDTAAGEALRRALGKTDGPLRLGVISTLADRREAAAVPEIVKFLGAADEALAGTAATALGRIGGVDAARALEAARPKAPEKLQPVVTGALLACADRLLDAGKKEDASRVYEALESPKEAKPIRLGALRGLAAARGEAAVPKLVAAMRDADLVIRRTAIQIAGSVKGPAAAKAYADLLPSLPTEDQPLLKAALEEPPKAEGKK
jgi:HEAT repeat protein